MGMRSPDFSPNGGKPLTSRGYRITVDKGRDSFFAICLEELDSETAWIMSDTVRTLEEMQ